MMEFDAEEEQRFANELSEKLFDISREYNVNQVASAAFSLAMTAVGENNVIAERQHMLRYMMEAIQIEYNRLSSESNKPTNALLH